MKPQIQETDQQVGLALYGEDGGRPERSTGTDNRTEALKIASSGPLRNLPSRGNHPDN
jgi:hypothetical protein